MRLSSVGAAGMGLVLAACATRGAHRPEDDSRYFGCRVERTDSRGTVALFAAVAADGTRDRQISSWQARSRRLGVRLRIEWEGPLPPAPTDDPTVAVSFRRSWLPRRQVRIELSRNDERTGEGVLANPYYSRGYDNPILTRRRSELSTLAAGAPSLIAVVAEEDRGPLVEDRIDMVLFDIAAQASAEAQPGLDAMIADYRNACRPLRETIIVT